MKWGRFPHCSLSGGKRTLKLNLYLVILLVK
nr:MAG TPA: hypothetical protein [Caudoviricetes sp.]